MNIARAVHSLSLLSSEAFVFSEDRDKINSLMLSPPLAAPFWSLGYGAYVMGNLSFRLRSPYHLHLHLMYHKS
jgi:hypothetical protein